MAISSLNVYSAQEVNNFNDLKNAIDNNESPVEIETGSNIQFNSLIEYSDKDVTITGQENSSFTPSNTASETGAFQVQGADSSLTIQGVKFDSFGEESEKGVGYVIFSQGDVKIGPGVEFGSSIKTTPYGSGSYRVNGTILMYGGTLTLESSGTGNVIFDKQINSTESTYDITLFGDNLNIDIKGDGGTVEIGNGIRSYNDNQKINHSGANEFVLGGNNNNFTGKYTQNNAEGKTTFNGTKYFKGESNIQAGTFNWQAANNDTGRGSIIFGDNTNLTVGDGLTTSKLTLSSKDTIAQSIHMEVQKDSELTLDGFNNKKTLTLSNKISGQGALKLTNDTITFNGESSGLSKDLKLTTQNANLTLTNMTNDTETLTTIAQGTNNNTILNLEKYSGTDNTGLTVDGKNIKELNFSGTNNYTLAEGTKLTVSATSDAAGVITNTASATTVISGDVTVGEAQGENTPSLVNTANAKLTINGTTGTLTNKGKVDNRGTLEAKTISNEGNFVSTGSLTADTLINGDESGTSGAHLNSTGTAFNVKSVTNKANITGTSAEFGSYDGSDAKSNLNLTGTLTLTGENAPSSNAIQNLGTISAAIIDVTDGNITNSGEITTGDITLTKGDLINGSTSKGTITANNITVTGKIKNDVAGSKINATGKISATDVTNSGELIQGSELNFDSLANNTGLIESTSGGITITKTATNAGNITSKGKLTVTESLTNTGNIKMNGGELKAIDNKESGSITNTGELTISGNVTGTDASAVITNQGGKLTLSGDASSYTGTFTQTAGETTASSNSLFGGEKNIQGGTLTASGSALYKGLVNLSNGSTFNYTVNGDLTENGTIDNKLLQFSSDNGGNANFTGNGTGTVFTLSDNITNENLGSVTFNNSSLKLSGSNFGYKNFTLNNSTLDLHDDDNTINSYIFESFAAPKSSKSKIDFDIKFKDGNVLETDSLTVNSGSGELGLGNIFISSEKNVEKGQSFTTKENEGVLRGTGTGAYGLKLSNGDTKTGVKGATTAFEYDITVNNDQKGITADISGIADENSLYKMDSETTDNRFFQFSTDDDQVYNIGKSLEKTLDGNFTVQGRSNTASDSVLSGKLKQGGIVTENKGSFFNIEESGNVNLTVKNLTIKDADSTERGGSVLHNASENSSVILDNLNITGNSSSSSTGKGGAIYNNGGQENVESAAFTTGLWVKNSTFSNNKAYANGDGGAIYNDSNGFILLDGVTTEAATADANNDIYNKGFIQTQGENTFNSLYTNDSDGVSFFTGTNTFSELANNSTGSLPEPNSDYSMAFYGKNTVTESFENNGNTVNRENLTFTEDSTFTNSQKFDNSGIMEFNGDELNNTGNFTNKEDADFSISANSSVTGNGKFINNGDLELEGDASKYTGNFTQDGDNAETDVLGTFFGGESNVTAGQFNWFTKNDLADDAKLNISGEKTVFNVGDNDTDAGEITFKANSSVAKEVTTNIWKNGKLNVEGGDVILSQGNWLGSVNLKDGTLTLDDLTNNYEEGTGTLTAEKGKLNLTGETQLVLGEGSTIEDAVIADIGENSQVYLEKGSLTLNNEDNWSGAVVLDDDSQGILTLKDYEKKLGKLQASSGSVNIENSKITFKSDDEYDSGIEKKVKTKIDANSEVTLSKGGYLELDDDTDTADEWQGKVILDGGILDYGMKDPKDAGTLNATKGNLNLLSGSVLNIEKTSSVADEVSVDIQHGSTVDIKEEGAIFNIDSKTNDKWNGLVKNEGGNFNVSGIDNTKGHGGGLQQTKGKTTLTDESNIYISDSNSYITGGDVDIDGKSKLSFGAGVKELNAENLKMSDNTQLGILNGEINSAHADNVEVNGNANFTVDLNPRDWKGDQFDFGSIKGTDATLNVSDFNFTGGAPIDRYIYFTLFTGDKSGVNFDATKDLKFTPIGYYGLESRGQGRYRAFLDHYNPQVFRGQVATMAMYTSQLHVDDIVTNHFILHNDRLIDNAKLANKYAAASTLFEPYQKTYKDGGLWSKSYVSFDKMDLTQGLSVKNNIYGMLIGADLPSVKLKNNWEFIPTGYVGYNGGHQHFDGVSMYQNGGQLGVMGTFIKDKFIGSITAYGGGYMNDMDVAGFEDNAGNWFAGSAAKAAYNYKPFKDFTVQPNLFIAYNAFGKQNWGTNYGIMGMQSGMLNGVNVAPGLNLILQKKTWSLYAGASYMYFINDKLDGHAGNVHLPNVRMDHGYVQYGIGGTKTWKDRFAAYGQINIRNAGINGIGFQAGVNYLFDLNKPTKKVVNGTKSAVNTISDGSQKTYIKVVKMVKNK